MESSLFAPKAMVAAAPAGFWPLLSVPFNNQITKSIA
jgi:hypothetical protein